jgi:hypothetical protein
MASARTSCSLKSAKRFTGVASVPQGNIRTPLKLKS